MICKVCGKSIIDGDFCDEHQPDDEVTLDALAAWLRSEEKKQRDFAAAVSIPLVKDTFNSIADVYLGWIAAVERAIDRLHVARKH